MRYDCPRISRFTQEDSYWGNGLNLYAYCRNNPVFYIDPSGYTNQNIIPNTEYPEEVAKQIILSGKLEKKEISEKQEYLHELNSLH